MSAACASAASVSALFVRSGPQPAFARSWLVRSRTCASAGPDPPTGFEVFVVLVGVGVAERVDVVGCGVRELLRLGAVVDRVGFGVTLLAVDGVLDGVGVVRRGVDDGLVGRTGVAEASSAAVVIAVIGSCRLVTRVSDVRMTNHPTPAIRTRADKDARSGPATPFLRVGRRWFVMLSSLAQAGACPLLGSLRLTTL
jgi:hypothetical protein